MKIACFSLPKSFLGTSEKITIFKVLSLECKELAYLFIPSQGRMKEYVLRTCVKTWSWLQNWFLEAIYNGVTTHHSRPGFLSNYVQLNKSENTFSLNLKKT